jgi:hypothetical protein
MSVVSVRLANSLHDKLKKIAVNEGVSLNQLINLSLTEKATRVEADHWWIQKGGDISREEALGLLNKVPDSSPDGNDKI